MIRWRRGTVLTLGRRWPGSVELTVEVGGTVLPALAHPALVGEPVPGDAVLLNVGALERELGTGGYALVVALPDRLPPDADTPGHLIKARYTPMQVLVQGADEQGSEHHDLLADDRPLPGTPVVVAGLHSSLPAVLAGLGPGPRVAYVMTDGGALPLWFSRTVAGLAARLAGTVTVGQAFGGDLECVTLHSGLLAAVRVLRADVVVVTQGPGNLGTGTTWGFSGVATGEAVNAAAAVGADRWACCGSRRSTRGHDTAASATTPSPRTAGSRWRPPTSRSRAAWRWTRSCSRGTGSSRWIPTGCSTPCARAPSRCPRWGAAWPRTRSPLWSPPPPVATPPACWTTRRPVQRHRIGVGGPAS